MMLFISAKTNKKYHTFDVVTTVYELFFSFVKQVIPPIIHATYEHVG